MGLIDGSVLIFLLVLLVMKLWLVAEGMIEYFSEDE